MESLLIFQMIDQTESINQASCATTFNVNILNINCDSSKLERDTTWCHLKCHFVKVGHL